jgi:MFS family permease
VAVIDPAPSDRVFTRGFCLAFASSLCYFSGIGVVLPVLPVYITHHLHGNNLTVGIVVGIFAASAVLARPIAGRLGNRLGRRLLMVMGAALVGVSLLLYGTEGLAVLVLLRLVTGAGEGLYFTGSTTLVADMAPPDRRGQVLSYFSVALFTGLGVGPVLGQAIYARVGASAAFTAAGGLALVSSLVATRVPSSRMAGQPAEATGHFLNRQAIGPGLVLTLGIMGITAFQAYTPLYVERLHMGGPEYVFLLYAIVVLVTRIVGAPLSDRVGVPRVATAATSLIVVGLSVMALWGTAVGLYVGTVPFALGISLQYPALMTMVVNRVPSHERSSAVGTFTTAFDLSQGASGVILGLVAAAAGFRMSFAAAAGFALIGLIVFWGWVGRPTAPIPGQPIESERQVLGDPAAWLPPGAD